MGHGQRGVLPGAAAPPAPSSESPRMRPRRRTARSAGSTTVGAGSSAATTKPADSSVPMMAAAGPSTRSRPPRVQHRKVSGSSSHRWGALTLASRQYRPPASPSASMAPARCRNGPPGSPKQAQNAAMALQPSRGSSSSTARITGAALVAAACRASSQRMRRTAARQGAGRKSSCCFVQERPGGRGAHPTMPGRPPMRLLWQVIANFAATCRYGYICDIRAARKIIWRNRRKSPKNVSVTTPNRRPAQFCVGVHVQCVSDRARTARPRIRDASGAQT